MQTFLVHVVEGTYKAEDLVDGLELSGVSGAPLRINTREGADGQVITIRGPGGLLTVTNADIMGAASTVHVTDSLLWAGGSPSPTNWAARTYFPPQPTAPADTALFATLASDAELTLFYQLLLETGAAEDLESNETAAYTILAPTNTKWNTFSECDYGGGCNGFGGVMDQPFDEVCHFVPA